jgi:lysozyme family protein
MRSIEGDFAHTIDRAVLYVMQNEGGFSDHSADPGGATNFGISIRYAKTVGDIDGDGFDEFDFDLDGKVTADDIKEMPRDEAENHYGYLFHKWRIDDINEPAVAIKIYDLHFPMGPAGAGKVVQRALRACGHQVVEDGVIGSKTIKAVNSVPSQYMLIALMSEAAGYFRSLHSKEFEAGWLNRAYQLPHMEIQSA